VVGFIVGLTAVDLILLMWGPPLLGRAIVRTLFGAAWIGWRRQALRKSSAKGAKKAPSWRLPAALGLSLISFASIAVLRMLHADLSALYGDLHDPLILGYVILAAPFSEELLFRQGFYEELTRALPNKPKVATAINAAAFGLFHLSYGALVLLAVWAPALECGEEGCYPPLIKLQVLAATAVGALLARLRRSERTFLPGVALHAALNAVIVGASLVWPA
jgi:membrane protease YdiL (CAAX protease family)